MRHEAEQMYWVHTRGLTVTLPPDSTRAIAQSSFSSGQIPDDEAQRLRVINGDPILKKRYPNPQDGVDYMSQVCPTWRRELYDRALDVGKTIVAEAKAIGKPDIAILLFGSVAKSLTKYREHEDPSNIDLTVIGHFTRSDRDELLDRIRSERERHAAVIRNNVGVFVQDISAVKNNDFNSALGYIGSSARPLHDPYGIWRRIEAEAITVSKGLKRFG